MVGNTTVHAQLYQSSGGGAYSPVGVPVDLIPTISGLTIGQNLTGTVAENFSLVPGDQYTLVFYATTDSLLGTSTVTGSGSGGITV